MWANGQERLVGSNGLVLWIKSPERTDSRQQKDAVSKGK